MNVLLSIKPEFAEQILAGEKQYEFRRTTFSDPSQVDTIYLYASSPVQQILGAFTPGDVVEGDPEFLWSECGDGSGIDDKTRFMEYFSGTDTGYAIEVAGSTRLSQPVDPRNFIDDFRPPVSFQYVNDECDHLLAEPPQTGSD